MALGGRDCGPTPNNSSSIGAGRSNLCGCENYLHYGVVKQEADDITKKATDNFCLPHRAGHLRIGGM